MALDRVPLVDCKSVFAIGADFVMSEATFQCAYRRTDGRGALMLACGRACRLGSAEAPFIGLNIGLRRGFQMPPCQRDQFLALRVAQCPDHVEMVAPRPIELFGKSIGVGADAIDLLRKQIDGLDQAGIAAEAEERLVEA